DRVAQFLDGGLKASTAQGGRAHVHAAAALAEVHGNADDANFLRHLSLEFLDPRSLAWEGARKFGAQKERKARIAYLSTNTLLDAPPRRELPALKDTRDKSCGGRG